MGEGGGILMGSSSRATGVLGGWLSCECESGNLGLATLTQSLWGVGTNGGAPCACLMCHGFS
jgi:hypothetical protein